uniref:Uncharacterized protein n=1 Tax=Siphoviridae sp. ctoSr5 TaxID=2826460 RepID=A0A8S5MUN0_9CAUD|nr:MAG TPA: hypothetical protein [Siphoviridae sp. ctoSr5]
MAVALVKLSIISILHDFTSLDYFKCIIACFLFFVKRSYRKILT